MRPLRAGEVRDRSLEASGVSRLDARSRNPTLSRRKARAARGGMTWPQPVGTVVYERNAYGEVLLIRSRKTDSALDYGRPRREEATGRLRDVHSKLLRLRRRLDQASSELSVASFTYHPATMTCRSDSVVTTSRRRAHKLSLPESPLMPAETARRGAVLDFGEIVSHGVPKLIGHRRARYWSWTFSGGSRHEAARVRNECHAVATPLDFALESLKSDDVRSSRWRRLPAFSEERDREISERRSRNRAVGDASQLAGVLYTARTLDRVGWGQTEIVRWLRTTLLG